MCGIFGFVGFRDKELLSLMGTSIMHRGPDDQNYYLEENLGIGYRRLAIIDVKGSFQPLNNENQTISLFFNGEIYNFESIRQTLKEKHIFKTNGDGETIIHSYEEDGFKCFAKLNGMFGLALHDRKTQRLILARDHFGIKPLYFWSLRGKIIFASEIKSIIKVLDRLNEEIEPNSQIIKEYLLHRVHDHTNDTFFKNIFRVPHASALIYDLNQHTFEIKQFWQPTIDQGVAHSNDSTTIQRFRELFLDSIKLRLISDVSVGSALSGGLDSSAVVRAVHETLQKNVSQKINKAIGPNQKTFSAIFPNQINNEKKYIDFACNGLSVESFYVEPKRDELWKNIKNLIYHQDEPMISSGPFAQWSVMKKVHDQKVKVLLDGQGADEMLAGYIPYYFVYFKQLIVERKIMTLIKEILLSLDVTIPLLFAKLSDRTLNTCKLFNFDYKNKVYVNTTNLNLRLAEDMFANSLPALLRYEDKNSMAFSIESRVPFLDYRLVEFCFSLPAKFKIRNGWNKWIMRQALKDLLPSKIVWRRWKVGFTTPEFVWMKKSKVEIKEIFHSKMFLNRSYFKPKEIQQAFESFLSGETLDGSVFWRIVNLELWLRIFIDPYVKKKNNTHITS